MKDASSSPTRIIARYLSTKATEKDINQVDVQNLIKRSSGYVSERFSGAKSFTIPELDAIAKLLGMRDAFELIGAAQNNSKK